MQSIIQNPKSKILKAAGLAGAICVVLLLLGGSFSSTNFTLDQASTPTGGGDAFSANYHVTAMVPESPAGPRAESTNYHLNTDIIPETFGPVTTVPPVITAGPDVIYISDDRALIEWETDVLADGVVEYGLTSGFGQVEFQASGYSRLHQVLLLGLAADTLYHFRVGSTDPYMNGPTFSAPDSFQTGQFPDTSVPVISTPVVSFPAVGSALIEFTTNKAAVAAIGHGPTAALGNVDAGEAYEFTHARRLDGLPPGTTYWYELEAQDPSGNTSFISLDSFDLPGAVMIHTTTLPQAGLDRPYSEMIEVTGGVGAITWTVIGGALPSGLALDPDTGELAGTPDELGSFGFTVEARDSGSPVNSATQTLVLIVDVAPPSRKRSDKSRCSSGHDGSLPALALLGLLGVAAYRRRLA
jgi:MYXO-CTERM domain-containing protein